MLLRYVDAFSAVSARQLVAIDAQLETGQGRFAAVWLAQHGTTAERVLWSARLMLNDHRYIDLLMMAVDAALRLRAVGCSYIAEAARAVVRLPPRLERRRELVKKLRQLARRSAQAAVQSRDRTGQPLPGPAPPCPVI
jgi:hypothetical protein